jgi:hypothetical protein
MHRVRQGRTTQKAKHIKQIAQEIKRPRIHAPILHAESRLTKEIVPTARKKSPSPQTTLRSIDNFTDAIAS